MRAALAPDVAAIMLTNPNTCGLFERDIVEIADAVHAAGAYFYCDGANFNAIMGKVRPGDLGVDAMHINLHKTFSTPHGGGGPGAGPVVLSERARAVCAGAVRSSANGDALSLVEHGDGTQAFGRMNAFHGQMGMFVRALAYMLSPRRATGCGRRRRTRCSPPITCAPRSSDLMSAPFGDRPCMHEALFDDRLLKDTGVTTLDFAKAMIDEGYHPMTMYFPLVVHGAMLIEPTESESKASLDLFIMTLRDLAMSALAGERERFVAAPRRRAAPAARRDPGGAPADAALGEAGAG